MVYSDTAFHKPQGVRRAHGEAEGVERGQISKTLLWQSKEFTFYSETTGVCLKEFERRRGMAIVVVGKGQSGLTVQTLWGWATR